MQARYCTMFIRKSKNRSGSTSIQIVQKLYGKNKVIRTIGTSSDPETIEKLHKRAQQKLPELAGRPEFNFEIQKEEELVDLFYRGVQSIYLVGPELLLGKIFDTIGFNQVSGELFRHLVIARLISPSSKLKTIDYLFKYKGADYQIDQVYRYLDKLHKNDIAFVQQLGYMHGKNITGDLPSVVFYDVTTLYFETEDEDDLRKTGFSKEGKHKNPQILLGLLVNASGFPLGYEIFEGNKYEGHTMLPVVEAFKNKYHIETLVIVADAGLMTKKNIDELTERNYQFIIGARIKSESNAIRKQILAMQLKQGGSGVIAKENSVKLFVCHSQQREKKDEYNRRRGMEKLKRMMKNGVLTKQHLTQRGYNKYLRLKGDTTISIDEEKFIEDGKWDGLKGYLTNTALPMKEVIEQYQQLWKVEKAFRISKTDLRIRPIYHHLRRRIESHICIAFAACVVYKELERQLYLIKSPLSPEKVLAILKTIFALTFKTPYSDTTYTRLLLTKDEQISLVNIFNLNFG